MNKNLKKLFARLFVYLIIAAFLGIYLFICKMGYGIPCFFYEKFHIVCPSCGATRAFISIMSLDFASAIEYNPVFALALYPISAIFIVQDIYASIYGVVKKQEIISLVEYIFKGNNKVINK